MQVTVYISWILNFFEFLIIFHGETLFRLKENLLIIFIHFMCIMSILNFKQKQLSFEYFAGSGVGVIGSLLPLLIELYSRCQANGMYSSKHKVA